MIRSPITISLEGSLPMLMVCFSSRCICLSGRTLVLTSSKGVEERVSAICVPLLGSSEEREETCDLCGGLPAAPAIGGFCGLCPAWGLGGIGPAGGGWAGPGENAFCADCCCGCGLGNGC